MTTNRYKLKLKGASFVEFTGRQLLSYRENDERHISLYRMAEGEIGEYALYVKVEGGENKFYCFGEDEKGGLRLTPELTSRK